MGFQRMSFKNSETVEFADTKDLKDQFLASPLNAMTEMAAIQNLDTKIDVPNRFATYNSKTKAHYGIVSDKYGIIQNDVVFELFETVCNELDMMPDKMVSSDGGNHILLSTQAPARIQANVDEDVIKQIVIRNSNDGKGGLTVNMNVVRQVCSNGLIGLVADAKSSFRITHTQAINRKFNEILGQSQMFNDVFLKFQDNVKALCQRQVDSKLVEDFLMECVSKSKKSDERDIVEDLFQYGKGNKGETAYDLYNGYVEHLDNTNDRNMMNDMFGPVGAKKKKAYDWLTKELAL